MATIQHTTFVNRFSAPLDGFSEVAKNEELDENDLRLFIFLCPRLESKHCSKLDLDRISESLGIPKKKIKRSIENLILQNIICEDEDDHVKHGYRFTYTESCHDD